MYIISGIYIYIYIYIHFFNEVCAANIELHNVTRLTHYSLIIINKFTIIIINVTINFSDVRLECFPLKGFF